MSYAAWLFMGLSIVQLKEKRDKHTEAASRRQEAFKAGKTHGVSLYSCPTYKVPSVYLLLLAFCLDGGCQMVSL